MWNRIALVVILLVGLGFGLSTLASAQPKTKQEAKKKERAKESEEGKALRNLALADQLIDYGFANQSPSALLLAAEIIHDNPIQAAKDEGKRLIKTEKVEKVQGKSEPRTAETVLAKAKAMAKEVGGKDYEALIRTTEQKLKEKSRSPYPHGCFVRHGHLHGKDKQSFFLHCHGHTHASLHPHFPNQHVDLDLYIYDSYGNLIATDTSLSPSAHVHWDGDGDFRIEVYMYTGQGHCNYTLRVN